MSFKEIPVSELKLSPHNFGKDWMALAAGNKESYNAMTVAWGAIGEVWGLPAATVYVRPQRYTKEFTDREDFFTLSWFGVNDEGRKALGYLGSHSGRNEDKIKNAGLTPVFADGTIYFEEAKLVVICRKMYQAWLKEDGFTDKKVMEKIYPLKDFHEMYIGEIIRVLSQE